jgi:hypothetical protein
MFDFFDGMFGIYFPLINSENINTNYETTGDGKYWARISYNLDFNRANPWRVVDRLTF